MAASMVRCRLCQTSRIFLKQQARHVSNQYYVLLPEIPPDTSETNAIMRHREYPEFSEISPDNTITGCAKLAINYDVAIGKHVEHMKDAGLQKTFGNVFDPIEEMAVPLSYAWRTAKNLNYTCGGDYHTAFQRIHPQVERARNERWTSLSLYHAVKEVSKESTDMSEFQQRLVDMYLLEARLNGIELSGEDKKRFVSTLGKLVEAKTHFRNRVMLSHNMFSHVLDQFGQLEEIPKSVLTSMALDRSNPSRGPWKVTLNQPVYQPMMEYCGDRMMRWNLWRAYNNRASNVFDDQNLSNALLIKHIRNHRKDIANLLGYETFAHMSMETKMAGSVENVMNMIESLKSKFKPVAIEELVALENFAKEEGFGSDLELWDIPYWRRRMKEHLFRVDAAEVAEYFPLPKVLAGLFGLCHSLFGIRIQNCTGEVDTWNETVQFYKVFDESGGPEIAAFYLDPYARPEGKTAGAWMEAGRERSHLTGTSTISYLNMNLTSPVASQPALMTMEQVTTLFYEFGHGLQQMLTAVPYSEIAGQRNIEWDALQVCATVMSMLLHTPQVLRGISCHVATGEQLPTQTVHTLLKAQRFLSSYDTMRQLYISALDMEMYISDEHWQETMHKVWPEFIPLQLHDEDQHICSLTSIFSDQYPAAYYSFKWSEMIAADVFRAFEEAELESPEKVAIVGRRFRETFLELGGGVPANEVFRRFRGRDPSQESLFRHYGLN